MTGWVEVAFTAFALQLSVLPGEKVQFIIAGLATRYSPLVVVAAAGTAFAGWTAVEIVFGELVRSALPGWALSLITIGLFGLFAVLLVRSAPESGDLGAEVPVEADGGLDNQYVEQVESFELPVVGRPRWLGSFLPIFLMMAAGEFGDKTQLITIDLAIQYGAHPAIWVGEMAAIIPVSLANAYFFHTFSHRFDVRNAHYAGAAIFAFFALDGVLQLVFDVSVWEEIVAAASDLIAVVL